MISPAIAAISIAVFGIVAFASGFVVSHWRDSGEIQRLESRSSVLTAANDKCAQDIRTVRAALQGMVDAEDARNMAAANAMKAAQPAASARLSNIMEIRAKPVIAAEHQCEAITKEQLEYVATRRLH